MVAQQVHDRHRIGDIAGRGRNSTPRCTCTYCDDGGCSGCELLQPSSGRDRLRTAVLALLDAHRGPIAAKSASNRLVRHRALVKHHVLRPELARLCKVIGLHELLSCGYRKDRMVQDHLGEAGNCRGEELFYAGILRSNSRNRTTVTTHAGEPEGMDVGDRPAVQSEPRQVSRCAFDGRGIGCFSHCSSPAKQDSTSVHLPPRARSTTGQWPLFWELSAEPKVWPACSRRFASVQRRCSRGRCWGAPTGARGTAH